MNVFRFFVGMVIELEPDVRTGEMRSWDRRYLEWLQRPTRPRLGR